MPEPRTTVSRADARDKIARNIRWLAFLMLAILISTALVLFHPQLLRAMVECSIVINTHADNFLTTLDYNRALLVIATGFGLMSAYLLLERRILRPLKRITQLLQNIMTNVAHEHGAAHSLLDVRGMAMDLARFAGLAQEYYRKHQEVSYALNESREIIAQITQQQETVLTSTNREIVDQYRSVLSYANYLEEQIQSKTADEGLRYDFDDVCESSFNLKLIAGALTLLRSGAKPEHSAVPLASLMQQTMLALAPSLDRRAMKLSTAEVDISVIARSDPTIISQVLWMMLLGIIRYAADESTLRLRCLYNRERTHTMISMVVSELAPGALSNEERGAHMVRQLQHLTPHMFAETMRIHANLQLAELLLKQLDCSITILPLTSHACEICLTLPASE